MTIYVVILVVSLIAAALAAAAETSLTSVSRMRIRLLADEGNSRARAVFRLRADPNRYLSTILAVNTVAVIAASTAAALIGVEYARSISQALITVVLSLVVLIACEIAPKTFALRFSEKLALALVGPVTVVTTVLRPVIFALTAIAAALVRPFSGGGALPGPFMTEDDVKLMITVGEEQGVVEQEEREMIHGVLDMTDKSVKEIMVPRVDVIGLSVDKHASDMISLILEHGHSRVPVYEESIDNIVGVVYAKDLLQHGVRSDDATPIRELAREPLFTPETKKVGELLHEMQERKIHLAVVVDEYGGTAGIITIEDMIEEIVGPIRDEYDTAEPEEMQFLSDREVLLQARVSIDDVCELLHMDVPDVDADSIGGLVYELLGEIPKAGEVVTLGNAEIVVESIRRQSIQSVRVRSPEPFFRPSSAPSAGGEDVQAPAVPVLAEAVGTDTAPLPTSPESLSGQQAGLGAAHGEADTKDEGAAEEESEPPPVQENGT